MLLIVSAVLAGNLNALFADFVWDDRLLIIGNSSVKRLDALPALFSQPFLKAYYRPVVMLSFAIEYAIYGLRPWGFHLTNLLLHAANAMLVFLLLERVARSRRTAFIAALLFAVHPANKAVITINDRTGLFAAFFFISAMLLYLEFRRSQGGGRRALSYAGCCILFALGLFSKEEALTLPLMLILLDSLILNAAEASSYAKRAMRYLPFFVLIAFYFWIRGRIIDTEVGIVEAFMTEPARRLMTVPSILIDYLLTLLVPVRINYDPRIPLGATILQPEILLPILLLAAAACAIGVLAVKAKREAFGALWFFITFAPMCNIVPIYADIAYVELTTPVRYLYLPSVGALLVAALVFEKLFGARAGEHAARDVRRAAAPAFCCLIFLFLVLSINRNILWRDEVLFYRRVIELHPENHKMHFNLGTVYMERGKLEAATEELTRAVTLAPDRAEYRNNLALAYKARGWSGRAIEESKSALRLDPSSVNAYATLAAIYTEQEELPEAIAAGEKAVGLAPSSLSARINLAEAYRASGDTAAAEEHYRAALAVDSGSAKAHYGLGMVYITGGHYSRAREELETALQIRPGMADAITNLEKLESSGY
jgi:tetratricopeptide (TPR) repeat protein